MSIQLKNEYDSLFVEVVEYTVKTGHVSITEIYNKFKVGYARAGRIIDQMTEANIIPKYEVGKLCKALITKEEWEEFKKNNNLNIENKEELKQERKEKILNTTKIILIVLWNILKWTLLIGITIIVTIFSVLVGSSKTAGLSGERKRGRKKSVPWTAPKMW